MTLAESVALIVENDAGAYRRTHEAIQRLEVEFNTQRYFKGKGHEVWTCEEFVRFSLADWLRALVIEETQEARERAPLPGPARLFDALAIDWVRTETDWNALARHFIAAHAECAA